MYMKLVIFVGSKLLQYVLSCTWLWKDKIIGFWFWVFDFSFLKCGLGLYILVLKDFVS